MNLEDEQRHASKEVVRKIVELGFSNNFLAIEEMLVENIKTGEYLSNPYLCMALVRCTYSCRHQLPSYQYILDSGYESMVFRKGKEEALFIFKGLPVSVK